MLKLRVVGLIMAGAALSGTAAMAQKRSADGPPPAQISGLLECRNIADSAQRLACYDKAVSVIGDAVSKKDLVVFDRESVRKTKRGLFGLSVPDLGIFGDEDNAVEVKQIDGEVVSTAMNGDGGYIIRLADGSRWSQTDGKPIALPPEAGDKVVVRKGTFGSYILSVGRQPGVKVRRIN